MGVVPDKTLLIRHLDFVATTKVKDLKDMREGTPMSLWGCDEGVPCKHIYHLGSDWQIVSDKPYSRGKEHILAFFRVFCRWSYDFRNYHDDIRADMSTLQQDVAEIKRSRKM